MGAHQPRHPPRGPARGPAAGGLELTGPGHHGPHQDGPHRDGALREDTWDVVVVGGGPAGAAAALSVLAERPTARVLVVDRAAFPRDKVCGDGVAAEVLDVLAGVGAGDVLAGWPVTTRLRISGAGSLAEGALPRPGWVVPREVLDARILARAEAAGVQRRTARVRSLAQGPDGVDLVTAAGPERPAGRIAARVVVGADGAHSVVRGALGPPRAGAGPGAGGGRGTGAAPTAIALRGYAPVRPELDGAQVIRFAQGRPRPAYAWSFPIGDGRANVGYGELLPAAGAGDRPAAGPTGRVRPGRGARPPAGAPTRAGLLEQLGQLLPGALDGVEQVAGHPLPLSTGRGAWGRGRVLLVGDAARLVNPVSGEGIFYAVLSGVLAGRAAAAALDRDGGAGAGELYATAVRHELGRHLRATDVAAAVVRSDVLLAAALRGCAGDARAFGDLCDLALARGLLTPQVLAQAGRRLPGALGTALWNAAGGVRRGP